MSPQWEHAACGRIHHGRVPPLCCLDCATGGWVYRGRSANPNKPVGGSRKKGRWISPFRRRRLYARDNYVCVKCGGDDYLTLDHILPRSRGGTNDDENLQTMCQDCNSRKGSTVEASA